MFRKLLDRGEAGTTGVLLRGIDREALSGSVQAEVGEPARSSKPRSTF
ncbi:hypothetical protein [Marivita cryptomonadis]